MTRKIRLSKRLSKKSKLGDTSFESSKLQCVLVARDGIISERKKHGINVVILYSGLEVCLREQPPKLVFLVAIV